MLEKIGALPEGLGEVEHLLADTGYFSAGNVGACEKAGVEPVIAMGRQPHHPPLSERFEKAPDAPKDPTLVEAMAHKLKTPPAVRSTPCANRRPNRCSASSNRCSASVTRCAASRKFAASGAS